MTMFTKLLWLLVGGAASRAQNRETLRGEQVSPRPGASLSTSPSLSEVPSSDHITEGSPCRGWRPPHSELPPDPSPGLWAARHCPSGKGRL